MKGRISSPYTKNGKLTVEVYFDTPPIDIEKYLEKELDIELKIYRENRSLDANRYAWKLITMIADVLRENKESVYLMMLKRYGQSEMVSVLSDINVEGYFKYYEDVARVKLQGKDFTHYKVYKGSSEYDTREMSILIDGIVSEAKELGIETMTPNEIERMKQQWKVS